MHGPVTRLRARARFAAFFAIYALVAMLVLGTSAVPVLATGPAPVVGYPVHMDVSPPLSSIQGQPDQTGQHSMKGPDRGQLPLPFNRSGAGPTTGTPTRAAPAPSAPTPGVNFDGVGLGLGSYVICCAPPDPNASVGLQHVVETVNLDFAIFNKSGGLLLGPVAINTVWSGFGGGCQTNNDGDPIVVYDQLADRWLISQFSVTTTPYLQCVAVSTTGDPTGTYYRYSFDYGSIDFPDYPKFGVWPDGYYVTFNLFTLGVLFNGAKSCSYDRAKMLTGAVATQVCFNTSSAYGGLLPTTLDGKRLPPAGTPNYQVATDTATTLVSWKFTPNWTTPASSTFVGPTSLAVASYASTFCPDARGACVPQGGTTQRLETLADRLMYRLAYRNFADHDALVVNHSIEVGSGSTLHAGVRWYELRPDTARNLTLFQSGTYAPDSNWRWMGSIAMDQAGNMGLGYSVSSSTISPQIHYTGRLAADPAGTMTQGENTIINGGGSQTGGLARWGDYTSMAIDPVDDCTFWYTNEYLKASGSFNWSTRIASFKLPGCGAPPTPDFTISASPSSQSVVQGQSTTYTVTATPTNGFNGTVTFSVSGLPAGATGTFNPASVMISGTTAATSTLTVVTATTTPTGSSALTITGASGTLSHTAGVTLVITGPPDFSLSATPASQTVVQGAGTSYTINITRTGGFTGAVTFSVSGLPAGAAGTFSPNPSSGASSTLSVTTATSTPTGSFPLTITGVSGTLTRTTSATLVVTTAPAGDFSLSISPATVTAKQGTNAVYTVTITRTGGFSGAVTFTISGLPAGTTATFVPSSTTGTSSTLTITTSQATPTGSKVFTVTGTSGTLVHTATATLSVTQGCFGGDGDC